MFLGVISNLGMHFIGYCLLFQGYKVHVTALHSKVIIKSVFLLSRKKAFEALGNSWLFFSFLLGLY